VTITCLFQCCSVAPPPRCRTRFAFHHLPTMSTIPYCCVLGESKVSLSIDAISEVSQISASVVYGLNLPCLFDGCGIQRSSVDVKVLTADGFYLSRMNLTVSYGLQSDVVLGSDWVVACQPAFIDRYPFISDPALEILQVLPPPHSWQRIDGSFICLQTSPL